jgi:hypothetical protein
VFLNYELIVWRLHVTILNYCWFELCMFELTGMGSEMGSETSWNIILNYCWFELCMFEHSPEGAEP